MIGFRSFALLSLTLVIGPLSGAVAATPAAQEPTRATLANGMRVVIIHSALAPVATVEANFLVGRLFPRDDSTEERGSLREGVAALDAKR